MSSVSAEITGGLFGNVENAKISIKNKLTINYCSSVALTIPPAEQRADQQGENTINVTKYELAGITAGGFAGRISNSSINLYASVAVNGVRINQANASSAAETEQVGIGGFVGVILNSKIDSVTDQGNLDITGVYVQNNTGTDYRHKIGGIAGFAYNSYFLFTGAKCTITNFSSRLTYGQVAGAIGLYVADKNLVRNGSANPVVVQRISVTGTTIVTAFTGNAAGLIGKINLTECAVTVQMCYGGNLCYTVKIETAAINASLGIG